MIIVNKRFIRIVDHLEKEVRIYDTINEKKIFNIFFNELDSAIGLNGALTDTVDLLNDLSEENDVLKQQLSEQGTEIDFLKDENTHMKCVLNKRRFRNNGQGNKLLHSWEVWRMNEKRFTLEEFGLNFIVNDNGRNLTAKQTVELLNELNDENEQLKARIQYLERKIERERNIHVKEHEKWEEEIQKENEQLKEFIDELYKKYEDAHGMNIENTDWF